MKNFLKNTAISFAVLTTMSSAVIAPAYAAEKALSFAANPCGGNGANGNAKCCAVKRIENK